MKDPSKGRIQDKRIPDKDVQTLPVRQNKIKKKKRWKVQISAKPPTDHSECQIEVMINQNNGVEFSVTAIFQFE